MHRNVCAGTSADASESARTPRQRSLDDDGDRVRPGDRHHVRRQHETRRRYRAAMAEMHDATEEYLETILELEEEGMVPIRARLVERLGGLRPGRLRAGSTGSSAAGTPSSSTTGACG